MMPEIDIARLRLRRFTASDLDDLMLIFGDPDVMTHLGMGCRNKCVHDLEGHD